MPAPSLYCLTGAIFYARSPLEGRCRRQRGVYPQISRIIANFHCPEKIKWDPEQPFLASIYHTRAFRMTAEIVGSPSSLLFRILTFYHSRILRHALTHLLISPFSFLLIVSSFPLPASSFIGAAGFPACLCVGLRAGRQVAFTHLRFYTFTLLPFPSFPLFQ